MPEISPHKAGLNSTVDSAVGGALALLIVYVSTFTSHPMDLTTAGAFIFIGSLLSSYPMAFLRRAFHRENSAINRTFLE